MASDQPKAFRTHELLSRALRHHESVRFLEDASEVRKWVEFDDEVYGPGVITYELLHGWWSIYKKGAIGLFRDDRIDAIFAIWPLKGLAFRQLLTGRKHEKDIGPGDVRSERQAKNCRTWYISGFAARATLRKRADGPCTCCVSPIWKSFSNFSQESRYRSKAAGRNPCALTSIRFLT